MTLRPLLAAAGLAAAACAAPADPAPADMMIVFLETNPDRPDLPEDALAALFEGHFANLAAMHADGRLYAAGPLVGGGGIAVLTTADVAEAEAWFENDPTVVAERFRLDYRPGRIAQGALCRIDDADARLAAHEIAYGPDAAGDVVIDVAGTEEDIAIRVVDAAPETPAADGTRHVFMAAGTLGAPCAGASLAAP